MSGTPARVEGSISMSIPVQGGKDLEGALREETALLESLIRLLDRQRRGIAEQDLGVIDETVHGSQRILLTLSEARKRRRRLVQIATGSTEEDEPDLVARLGPRTREAWGDLKLTAQKLSEALSVNQSVLREAIRFGEEYVRTVFRGVAQDPAAYDCEARATNEASGSVLINKRV
ncbi:MAG: flagellar protein FlgN [Gemmatimonadota bacterium]|nr:flagellar protein FlgN [Gemmatimonadota bacterium]